MINLKTSVLKTKFFDRLEAGERHLRKPLEKAGKTIRKISQRSMRRRKQASQPGSPPSARTDRSKGGLLRKRQYYYWDASTRSVVVGPQGTSSRPVVPGLHEFGGFKPNSSTRVRKVGESGEIRIARGPGGRSTKEVFGGRFAVYAKLLTQAQADRATRINMELFGTAKIAKYPRRPYMGPALKAAQPYIAEGFKDSIRLSTG